ncbi:hypothetical protein DACRYDRAFT_114478 [Dacryopinax primogenitus]|uniref:Uncharacterized protein n=1 Tax=Dacryopinax primogenitus (strain DJM 731) TaxID=1858805 RepID=M5G5R7_DACPD|nr:uncharacterized protein DACRYDRAFT_114478 [Dacryopinax primogenitus]EJU04059.1 hypothetical protein DACRYDRAFT_114478 [Dacryopinax primogenitus]
MSASRPRPPQTGHTRLPSGDFPTRIPLSISTDRITPEDDPFSPPIVGLGVSVTQAAHSAVQLVQPGERDEDDDDRDGEMTGGEDDDDAGTIREHPRRRKDAGSGHATQASNGSPHKWKGKARAVEVDLENGVGIQMGTLDYTQVDSVSPTASYPPVSDDTMEERKVAENLKRWEEQDRQRRKAARDARRSRAESSTGDPSLSAGSLAEVTRRASYLLRGGRRREGAPERTSVHSMTSDAPLRPLSMGVLRAGEPADAERGMLQEPATPSTARSQAHTFSPHTSPLSSRPPPAHLHTHTRSTSSGRSRPKHSRTPHGSSVSSAFGGMRETDGEDPFSARSSSEHARDMDHPLPPLPELEDVALQDTRWQPTLTRQMTASDGPSSSIESEPSPVPHSHTHQHTAKRWWLDWCCGCGGEESDDDDQAGRTNPFE